jgi:Fe-S oxidoreductase/nitrate reductase gamma subunit
MLPFPQKVAFLLFALVTGAIGLRGFYRVFERIRAGQKDTDLRFDHLPQRLWHALATTLTQSRTFRRRPFVSLFHSFIFYGFVFYLLVNLVDGLEGFASFGIPSTSGPGAIYNLSADLLSALVMVGVIALVFRRFLLPSRADFRFNERTMVAAEVPRRLIPRDSLIVSTFILLHVGSRALSAGAKLAIEGPDPFQPFAGWIARVIPLHAAPEIYVAGYWGALGSVFAFLMYFPFSKHIHIFMAPAKYFVSRHVPSGVLPAIKLDLEAEDLQAGAKTLGDLSWPRLLDAYACIQCNRCQDVCPATATGKALSPSALEINKRMELNTLAGEKPLPEGGQRPLLSFMLSPEAAWACTTCGACLEVCPVQDEPMLDIIDVRRHQVLIAGEFPAQLQTAFRGMERAQNPWGIAREKRMDWAEGLPVKTIDENPVPDVLYWVGCAASYDPQSQKTARAFVQLLHHAGVNFAVLGKKECCTGDSARRAGNEVLYQQLAIGNVTLLQQVKPRLIVASCPHCMNSIGQEYRQLGGDFAVMHHTEYLERLVGEGKLPVETSANTVTFHDPCYLGRHNGVYDAPRNLLRVLSNDVRELDRRRENSFCCGAGGAQFWKEEEPGTERISTNRFREAQNTLQGASDKVLAVGCPFCKSMLESTPGKGEDIAVKDVAELLWESVSHKYPAPVVPPKPANEIVQEPVIQNAPEVAKTENLTVEEAPSAAPAARKKWEPKKPVVPAADSVEAVAPPLPKRKAWVPKSSAEPPKEE